MAPLLLKVTCIHSKESGGIHHAAAIVLFNGRVLMINDSKLSTLTPTQRGLQYVFIRPSSRKYTRR